MSLGSRAYKILVARYRDLLGRRRVTEAEVRPSSFTLETLEPRVLLSADGPSVFGNADPISLDSSAIIATYEAMETTDDGISSDEISIQANFQTSQDYARRDPVPGDFNGDGVGNDADVVAFGKAIHDALKKLGFDLDDETLDLREADVPLFLDIPIRKSESVSDNSFTVVGPLAFQTADPSPASSTIFAPSNIVASSQSLNGGDPLPGDFNADGVWDDIDIDTLAAAIRDGLTDPEYDITGDTLVNVDDYDSIVLDLVQTGFGDINLDRQVDFNDFIIHQNNFNDPGNWGDGDVDGDGFVTFFDFLILQNNFDQDFRELTASLVNDTAVNDTTFVRQVLRPLPNTGVFKGPSSYNTSPRLDYLVNFTQTGTHYVWVRGGSASGGNDSLHVGLNNQQPTTAANMDFDAAWEWSNIKTTSSGDVIATIDVATTGTHTVNVWMREDGVNFDKIVISDDPNYPAPTGFGPELSLRYGTDQVFQFDDTSGLVAIEAEHYHLRVDREGISWTLQDNINASGGLANADGLTYDPTVSGRANFVSQISVFRAGFDATAIAQFIDITNELDLNGIFTLDQTDLDAIFGGTLTDGFHTLHLRAEDAGGQVIRAFDLDFTLDTIPPSQAVFSLDAASRLEPDTEALTALDMITLVGQADPNVEVLLEQTGATTLADGTGAFSFVDLSIDLGTSPFTTVVTDLAGHESRYDLSIARIETGDTFTLAEGDQFVVERSVLIDLGQEEGSRTLRFEIDPNFDTTDIGSTLEDHFLVYLRDPTQPGKTLLDRGIPGTALFSLSGDEADFLPGLVRFDGTAVEVDLTSLSIEDSGVLVFQLINSDSDMGSEVTVSAITNTLDEEGVANPVFFMPELFASTEDLIDVDSLNVSTDLQPQFRNVRLDTETGLYTIEMKVRNYGDAVNRNLAVLFNGLPSGVVLTNATGANSSGIPFVSMRNAVPSGGLSGGTESSYVELVFSNPNLDRFSLAPAVVTGGPNQAPVFDPVGPLSVMPGDILEVQLSATDLDGDTVTFALSSDDTLPTGMFETNGTLSFTPTPSELGSYDLTLIASDGALLSAPQAVTLNVVADPVTTTRISGVIQGTNQQPLDNVRIELGSTSIYTDTDSSGAFTLVFTGTPPSDTLKIRGEQITGSDVYPFIAEMLDLVLGHEVFDGVNNVIDRPIFLPVLDVAGGTNIGDPMYDGTVTQEIAPGEMAMVEVDAVNILMDDGSGNMVQFTGTLSITEVPPDLTPAALPKDLIPDLVVTIQPGEMEFTQSAPLTLPNRSGWEPGTIMELWSINPTTGDFDKVGTGEVSTDGSMIETITGGIENSSWHFFTPPPPAPESGEAVKENQDESTDDCTCENKEAAVSATSQVELHSGALIETHGLVSYQSLGVNRQLTLTYDSQRADPRPIMHFGYTGITTTSNRRAMARLQFERDGLTYQVPGAPDIYGLSGNEHFWSIPSGASDIRAAIQADLGTLPSGRYDYTLTTGIMLWNGSTLTGSTSDQTDDIIHVNTINSPFGSGWGLGDLQELVVNTDDSVLLINGDGGNALFEWDESEYISPIGDFSVLERLTNSSFRRTMTDKMVYTYADNVTDDGADLSSVIDRHGNETVYEYDGSGRLYRIIDPVGLVTEFDYSGPSGGGIRITKITDPANRDTHLEYDNDGNLIKITDPDQTFRTFEYDAQHHMTAEINKRGHREEAMYNFAGRVTQAIRKDGTTADFAPVQTQALLPSTATLDPSDAPPAFERSNEEIESFHTDPNGDVVQTQLDNKGQIVLSEDANGSLGVVKRNGENLVTERTQGRRFKTEFLYDSKGNIESITDFGAFKDQVEFDEESVISTGDSIAFVVLGDVNNDGFLDIVTANRNVHQVAVMLGDGLGSFDKNGRDEYFVGVSPVSVTLGDVDKDGYLDIVTANRDSNSVSVLLGLGDGSGDFDAVGRDDYLVGLAPESVALGDVDDDGDLDIVTANSDSDSVSVLLGLGDGSGDFDEIGRDDYLVGNNPRTVVLGDVDKDGDLDIVTANGNSISSVSVLLGLGNGSGDFDESERDDYSIGDVPESIALGDVDNDGDLDIVTGNRFTATVSVLLGLGDGSGDFDQIGRKEYSVDWWTESVVLGDVDNDGNLDIVTANYNASTVSVLVGTGFGDFNDDEPITLQISSTFEIVSVALGDLDNDSYLDIVAGTFFPGIIAISLNDSNFDQVTRTFMYDTDFSQLKSMTDERGHQTIYMIDEDNGDRLSERRVVGEIDDAINNETDDVVTIFTYTPEGLIDIITDPLGRMTDHRYDINGRLDKITFAKGTSDEAFQLYEYDPNTTAGLAGLVTAVIDENGHRTEFEYDELNRLKKIIEADPDGDQATGGGLLTSPITEFMYDNNGNRTEVIDARIYTTTSVYDPMDRLTSVTDELDNETTFEYDLAGNLIETTDAEDRVTTHRFDSRGRRIETLNPDGGVTAFRYDRDNNLTRITDPEGYETRLYYDPRGRVFRQQDALDNNTFFTYDGTDNLIEQTDRLERTTTFEYNELDRLVKTIHPDETFTELTYDKAGNVKTQTDEMDRVTEFNYDDRDRLFHTILPDPDGVAGSLLKPETFRSYDNVGNLETTTDAEGRVTVYEYDDLNRLIKTTLPDPDGTGSLPSPVVSQTYDAVGNVDTSTDAMGNTTTNIYDEINRLKMIIGPDPDGPGQLAPPVTEFTYDKVGNLKTVTDPIDRVTTHFYDPMNRLEKTVDPELGETIYTYDLNGNLLTLTDPANHANPNGQPTVYEYDELNRVITDTDPLGRTTTFEFDPVGTRSAVVDRNGRRTEFKYDLRDRPVTETWFDTDGTTVLNTITNDYDDVGNLLTATDSSSSLTFTYNDLNRLKTVDNDNTPYVPNVLLTYDYDSVGNVLSVTDDLTPSDPGSGTDETVTEYIYDDLDRLSVLTQSGSYASDKRANFYYNALGQFTSIARFNALTDTVATLVASSSYGYDDLNRLSTLKHFSLPEWFFNDYGFEYDPASQITQITDVDDTTDYDYDDNGRLELADRVSPGGSDETYDYDANGNRESSSLHGAGYDTNVANQVTTDGTYDYDYDLEGNLTTRTELSGPGAGSVREFEYDHRNRLTSVTDKDPVGVITLSITYTYDALNRRITKSVDLDGDGTGGEIATHFIYDREDVILDFEDSDGTAGPNAPVLVKRYFHGPGADMILAQEDFSGGGGGSVLWLFTDHLGTTRDILDNNGNLLNHIQYDSFGNILTQSDASVFTRYLFTGREYEAALGLYYYRARFYDPSLGKFIQRDPIGFKDGVNLYQYAHAQPTLLSDPSGTDTYRQNRQLNPNSLRRRDPREHPITHTFIFTTRRLPSGEEVVEHTYSWGNNYTNQVVWFRDAPEDVSAAKKALDQRRVYQSAPWYERIFLPDNWGERVGGEILDQFVEKAFNERLNPVHPSNNHPWELLNNCKHEADRLLRDAQNQLRRFLNNLNQRLRTDQSDRG